MDVIVPMLLGGLSTLFTIVVLAAVLLLIVWAVRSGSAKAKGFRSFYEELGLTVVSEDPVQITGSYREREVIISTTKVNNDRGRTVQLTRMFVSSPCAFTTTVQRTQRDWADTHQPGGEMSRVMTGDPTFDRRYEVYVRDESDKALWADEAQRARLLGLCAERRARMASFGGMMSLTTSAQQVSITLNCDPMIGNATTAGLRAALDLIVDLTE